MKFSGVTILQGVEFSIFPIDFEWALQQCSATALPVMTLKLNYTKETVFRRPLPLQNHFSLTVPDIDVVEHIKYLGILLSTNFNFEMHVSYLVKTYIVRKRTFSECCVAKD